MELSPKDKAKELIRRFRYGLDEMKPLNKNSPHVDQLLAEKCAIIATEEVLKAIPMYTGNLNPKWKYWNDVKEEIEKL